MTPNKNVSNQTNEVGQNSDVEERCAEFFSLMQVFFHFPFLAYIIAVTGIGLNLLVFGMSLIGRKCATIKFRHFAICTAQTDISCCIFLSFYFTTSFVDHYLGDFGISVLVAIRNYYLWLPTTVLIPTLITVVDMLQLSTQFDITNNSHQQ